MDIKGKNINFAVQVAKGKTCELLLYKRGKEVPEYQFDMPEEEGVGEVRFLSVEGLKADRYEYNFLIDGKVCVDPYVKRTCRKREVWCRTETSGTSDPWENCFNGGL